MKNQMIRFKMIGVVGGFLVGLSGCGSSDGGDNSATQTAEALSKAGPPIEQLNVNPELSSQYACAEKKVQICHIPPGNSEARHTLCIGMAAVKAHIGHHKAGAVSDYLGDCIQVPGGGGTEGGGTEGGGTEPPPGGYEGGTVSYHD